MNSPSVLIPQLLLVALISPFAGERLAALSRIVHLLQANNHDAHWLVERLSLADNPYEEIGRIRFERARERGWPT